MRDIFEEIFENQPLDPTEVRAALAADPACGRGSTRRRMSGEGTDGFPVLLDGKPVRTPARGLLAAPDRALAEALAAEWDAQTDKVDPAAMPLTRLANSIIDGVAPKPRRSRTRSKNISAPTCCSIAPTNRPDWSPASARTGTRLSIGRGKRSARALCWSRA